ncbi:hypothetical protein [Liquorilactobacillus mali]|uniref:hypothetical protein n=1 Tax=Liquorilactobacillus mali TaxID=1618 RepID=UPI0039EA66AF
MNEKEFLVFVNQESTTNVTEATSKFVLNKIFKYFCKIVNDYYASYEGAEHTLTAYRSNQSVSLSLKGIVLTYCYHNSAKIITLTFNVIQQNKFYYLGGNFIDSKNNKKLGITNVERNLNLFEKAAF